MVCVPCIVIPFLLWFFHRYMRPMVEKLCPSLLKYLPGGSKETTKDANGICPLRKKEQIDPTEKNITETNSEVTAGDGGTKKTN